MHVYLKMRASFAIRFFLLCILLSLTCTGRPQQKESECIDATIWDRDKNKEDFFLSYKQTRKIASNRITPIFPKGCRCLGNIVVLIKVSEKGEIICAQTDRGHPALRKSSLDAIKQWKFTYKVEGKEKSFIGKVAFYYSPSGKVTF